MKDCWITLAIRNNARSQRLFLNTHSLQEFPGSLHFVMADGLQM